MKFFHPILFFVLLGKLIICNALHAYQYFYFDEKKIKVSNENFSRYVRPILRKMVNDYYHIVYKLNPDDNSNSSEEIQSDLIQIRSVIHKANAMWKRWSVKCEQKPLSTSSPSRGTDAELLGLKPDISTEIISGIDEEYLPIQENLLGNISSCEYKLEDFYRDLKKLDKMVLNLQMKKFHFSNSISGRKIDSIIRLSETLDNISNRNYKVLHQLEEILISTNTPYANNRPFKIFLEEELHQMLLSSEVLIIGLMQDRFKNDFEFAWENFFKPIEEFVVFAGSQKYFIENMGEFNVSWHSFSMKMERGNLDLPQGVYSMIKELQGNWTSVLKVYLKDAVYLDTQIKKKKRTL